MSIHRGLSRLALLLIAVLAGCARLPPPWQPPADPAPSVYRGAPSMMAMSDDGSRVVIGFTSLAPDSLPPGTVPVAGFVVLDGRDGSTVFLREATRGRIHHLALSADGNYVLAIWTCPVQDERERTCSGQRAVETDLRAGAETVRLQHEPRQHRQQLALFSAGYDPAEPGRVLAVASWSHQFIDGKVLPCCRFQVLAHGRGAPPGGGTEVAYWEVGGVLGEGRISLGAPVLLAGGGLRFLSWQAGPQRGPTREITLRPGADPAVAAVPDRLARAASFRHASARDGGNVLLTVTSGEAYRGTDDIVLFGREQQANDAEHQGAGLRLAITQQAISADGRRGAFIAEPLDGSNPQPALHLLELTPTELVPRRVEALAAVGIGRTTFRARMPADELLRRLKALHDLGAVTDLTAVTRTLALQVADARGADTHRSRALSGDLAPIPSLATYGTFRPTQGDVAERDSLRLTLGAGPCLTTAHVERMFGPPGRDSIIVGMPPGPYRQPRASLHYDGGTGNFATFSFYYANCAVAAELGRVRRR